MMRSSENQLFWWRWSGLLLVFLLGILSMYQLHYAGDPKRWMTLPETAYFSWGLFFGINNPIGFPRTGQGPTWAVWLAGMMFFAAPLMLAWTLIEGGLRIARRFRQKLLGDSQVQLQGMRDHLVLCGLGKLGNLIADWVLKQNPDAKGGSIPLVVIERDAENPWLQPLRDRGVPILIGDQTQQDLLLRAGVERASRLIAVSGDDIANLDAAHIGRRLNPTLEVRCQVTDLQLQHLIEKASSMKIQTFSSYDIVAESLIKTMLQERVGDQPRPAFLLAGIGRFGRMMIKHLIQRYKDRDLRLLVLDRKGESLGRILRGTIQGAETFLPKDNVIAADINDPYVWREIRDREEMARAVIVLCTDDDVSNINTALMIEQQIDRDILVVSRMFRDVSFMDRKQDRFRVAIFNQLLQQGLSSILALSPPASSPKTPDAPPPASSAKA